MDFSSHVYVSHVSHADHGRHRISPDAAQGVRDALRPRRNCPVARRCGHRQRRHGCGAGTGPALGRARGAGQEPARRRPGRCGDRQLRGRAGDRSRSHRRLSGVGRGGSPPGLQGKAIHYYRGALERDPNNLAALSGEGEALLEKGAVEKARRKLAQLESLCGTSCSQTQQLAAALERGPKPATMTAEVVLPDPVVTQN